MTGRRLIAATLIMAGCLACSEAPPGEAGSGGRTSKDDLKSAGEPAGRDVEARENGPDSAPPMPGGPKALARTNWRILRFAGGRSGIDSAPHTLRFKAATWDGSVACATLSGTWKARGDHLIVGSEIATTEQMCPADLALIDDAFAELMRSNPRYLIGADGELSIQGGGHRLAARPQQ